MRKLGMGVLIGGLRQNSATFLKPNHLFIWLGQTQKSVPGKGHMRHIAPSFVYKGCFWE